MPIMEVINMIFSYVGTDVMILTISVGIHLLAFGKLRGFGRLSEWRRGHGKLGPQKPASKHQGPANASSIKNLKKVDLATSSEPASEEALLATASRAASQGDGDLAKVVLDALPAVLSKDLTIAALRLCTLDGPLAKVDPEAALQQFCGLRFWSASLADDAAHCVSGAVSTIFKQLIADEGIAKAFYVLNSCPVRIPALFTGFVKASLHGKDVTAAERVLQEAIDSNMVELLSFKLIVRFHIMSGDARRAQLQLQTLRNLGLAVTPAFFDDLFDAALRLNIDAFWGLMDEMRHFGVSPNAKIACQALRCAQRFKRSADLEKAIRLVDELGQELFNEALLSALCEAGMVHADFQSLLAEQLKKLGHPRTLPMSSCYTVANLIRAYGFIKDVPSIWAAWEEIEQRRIAPIAATLGVMVEALTLNNEVEAGHMLVRRCLQDSSTRPLVNAIIYNSVLRGYSHQKRFDRVWEVYAEMKVEKMRLSVVTYNSLLNACARSREVHRIVEMLEDMTKAGIEPDTVTYGSIIKCFCNGPDNHLSKAFKLLSRMSQPDEIAYNTVLDGCARFFQWGQGMQCLQEMQVAGVKPSNFTLSVVAKLANRCGAPEAAYTLTQELADKYKIRLNIHVFNNLIQASMMQGDRGDLYGALKTYGRLLDEKVRPDARTYSLLLRTALAKRHATDAAGLLRAAGGLAGAHSVAEAHRDLARPHGGLDADLVCDVIDGIACKCGNEKLAVELVCQLKGCAQLQVDLRRLVKSTCKSLVGAV